MKVKICSFILFSLILAGLSAVDVTIYEIQFTTSPSGDSPYAGQVVTTTGIVTGTGFAGYSDNFFISEPTGGAWKGVYIYDADQNVDLGDEIEITGTVSEYFGLTEIGSGT
ncbi:MAG: hypothetical protein JW784_00045, partial [Candidatus Cloacimonetes bacterium]|nr:hypothetical protein [Candidatus Cloacimonadota bacterium]